MSKTSMNRKTYAIVGGAVALVSLLAWTVNAWAGATAEARLLDAQLDTALTRVVVLESARAVAVAATDSVLAQADSVVAASAVAVADAQAGTDLAVASSEAAFSEVLVLAAGDSALTVALGELQAQHETEREAWQAERLEHTSAAFALTQQVRSLEGAFAREREAWRAETDGLRAALSLSQQESDAWQRAANPGLAKQVWQQGRAVLVVAALVVAFK